jgi:tetratricopeptide (TPR) repeat protein
MRAVRPSRIASELVSDGYSLREVGKLLGLSRSIVCGLIDAGFVTPTRGRRREYRFTFHDLVLLRAAQGLSEARLPPALIVRSLRRLRAQLPERVPLAGLRIEAVGDAVVVNEGVTQWQPDDGQYVLRFQVDAPGGRLSFLDAARSPTAADAGPERDAAADERAANECFGRAASLETTDSDAAVDAYRAALAANPAFLAAYTNLGRILHERHELTEAEEAYRQGLAQCGKDATLLFNLAVLLEDMHRPADAATAYRGALELEPDMSDAHYNLALLCEAQGMRQEALRHLSAFRKLNAQR